MWCNQFEAIKIPVAISSKHFRNRSWEFAQLQWRFFSELDEWLHTLAGRGLWQMGGVKGHNHFWPSFVLRLFLIACFWFGPEATDSITYLVPIVEVLPFFGRKEAGSSSFIYWPSLPVFLRLFHFTLVQCRTEKKRKE